MCISKIQDMEMDIRGRDLATGLPKTITVRSSEMLEALIEPAMMVVDAVHSVLEKHLQNCLLILAIEEYI